MSRSKLSTIICEIESRLVDAGYTVFLGRQIDVDQDPLPSVSVMLVPKDGITRTDGRPHMLRPHEARLAVEWFGRPPDYDRPLLDVIDEISALGSVIFAEEQADQPETLGGTCVVAEYVSAHHMIEDVHSDVHIAQILLDVDFNDT